MCGQWWVIYPTVQIIHTNLYDLLQMYHTVFNPEIGASLSMIGYIQPKGGLISISEIQAQWLGMIITGHCKLPDKNEMKERIAKDKVSFT